MAHDGSSQEVSQAPCMPCRASTPKMRKGHPQHIPPSNAERKDARLILPFVRERNVLDQSLKIGGNVKPEVLFHILRNYIDPVMTAAVATYKHAQDGEMRARPVISHLFPLIWQLVPRGRMLEKYMPTKDDALIVGFDAFSLKHLDQEDHLEQGDQGEEERRSKVPRLEEAQDSVFSLYENMHEKGALDFSFSGKLVTTSEDVWKLLMDGKDDKLGKEGRWSDVVVWQLLSYGALYGLDNAKKGRLNILHLAGMQLGVFAMAQLHVYGAIEVKKGKITNEGFKTYKLQEKFYIQTMEQCSPYCVTKARSKKELQEDLNMAKKEVENRVRDAKFLDGWYIVGDIYIDKEPVQWDGFDSKPPSYIAETMFVVEYLLEVLVGRETRLWTIADVDEIYRANKEKNSRDEHYQVLQSWALDHFHEWVQKFNRPPPGLGFRV